MRGTATYEFGSGKSFGWAQRICGADASEAWSPPVIAPYAAESRIGIAADSVRQWVSGNSGMGVSAASRIFESRVASRG